MALFSVTDRDGGYGNWTVYDSCSEECGSEGVKKRSRVCDNPTRMGKGAECEGDDEQTTPCNRKLVSV